MPTFSPTARRWELAARLRQLRTDAGRSVEEAAAELMCSPAKISRMETAGRGVQPRDVRDLCRLYGVPAAMQDELTILATDARKPGWWQDFRSLDEQAVTFIGLESAASDVLNFDPLRLPGACQTPEFTAGLLRNLRPAGELADQWISEVVETRRIRQKRYQDGEISLHAIVDEAALRRPVGSVEVMVAQLDRLVEDALRPTVTLQVVPFSTGSYPGLDGSFHLLSFSNDFLADVVWVEGLLGQFLVDKAEETAHYRRVFQAISKDFALSVEHSLTFIRSVRSDFARQLRESPRSASAS